MRPKYRGQGIMNLSIQLIVGFGLDIMGLNKISATTSLENKPALKLLEKLEFVRGEEKEGKVEYGIDARH
ncbi:MAG: GNAT family N-acetyltransferase [Saprospiraceae bacterium]|nr:GNAT family N-acetyltransferase [Candidatus Brachybacter algidus]